MRSGAKLCPLHVTGKENENWDRCRLGQSPQGRDNAPLSYSVFRRNEKWILRVSVLVLVLYLLCLLFRDNENWDGHLRTHPSLTIDTRITHPSLTIDTRIKMFMLDYKLRRQSKTLQLQVEVGGIHVCLVCATFPPHHLPKSHPSTSRPASTTFIQY
jgi:hypothetical protein